MPGFVEPDDEFKAKGIDAIACTAVNDVFVLTNWAKDTGAAGKIEMLADGSGEFRQSPSDFHVDLSNFGLGFTFEATMRCS